MKSYLLIFSLLLVGAGCTKSNTTAYHDKLAAAHEEMLQQVKVAEEHFHLFESNKTDLLGLSNAVNAFNAFADSIKLQVKSIEGPDKNALKIATIKYINGLKSVINKEFRNVAGIVIMSDEPLNRMENETTTSVIVKRTNAIEEAFQFQLNRFTHTYKKS